MAQAETEPDFQLLSAVRYDTTRPWLKSHPFVHELDEDSPVMLLRYHRDRMASAADAFGWKKAGEALRRDGALKEILKLAEDGIRRYCKENGKDFDDSIPYKIRPVVYKDGRMEITASPVEPRPYDILSASALKPDTIEAWLSSLPKPFTHLSVYADTEPTPRSLHSSFKTTKRDHYSAARERLGLPPSGFDKEVILYNELGEITESSLRNVSFWSDEHGMWITPPVESSGIPGTIRRWMIEQGRVKEKKVLKDELKDGTWVLLSNGLEGCSIGKFVKN